MFVEMARPDTGGWIAGLSVVREPHRMAARITRALAPPLSCGSCSRRLASDVAMAATRREKSPSPASSPLKQKSGRRTRIRVLVVRLRDPVSCERSPPTPSRFPPRTSNSLSVSCASVPLLARLL